MRAITAIVFSLAVIAANAAIPGVGAFKTNNFKWDGQSMSFQSNQVLGALTLNDGGLLVTNKPASTNKPFVWLSQGTIAGNFEDIRNYGADSNAITDSRNAIQMAINRAGPQGTVFIPAGNYKVVTSLPIQGWVRKIYGPGKIWVSLPTGYVNPGVYGVNDSWTNTNVLDRNGNYVTWVSTNTVNGPGIYYGSFPWNGKSYLFQDIGGPDGCEISLNIDGGWGTIGPPGTVIPVTGISRGLDENQYYALFANINRASFVGCRIVNAPGEVASHCFQGTVMRDCSILEFGDHCYYTTAEDNVMIVNNTVVCARPDSGIDGTTSFISQSYRDAFKLRNCRNGTVQNNIYNDATALPKTQFMTVESNPMIGSAFYTHGSERINVSGNNVRAFAGFILDNWRWTNATDNGGFYTRDVSISGNTFETWNNLLQGDYFACVNFSFANNTCFIHSGTLAAIQGSQVYNNAIQNFVIGPGVICTSTNAAASPIKLGGRIQDFKVLNSTFTETNVNNGLAVCLVSLAGSDLTAAYNSFGGLLSNILVKGNTLQNYYAEIYDPGWVTWVSTNSYLFSTPVFDDGLQETFSVVRDPTDFLAYTNKAQIAPGGSQPHLDAANWGLYNPPASVIKLFDNYRYCDSTNGGNQTSLLLANCDQNTVLHYDYKLRHGGNQHDNGLNNPIDYKFMPGTNANSVTLVTTNLYGLANAYTAIQGVTAGATNPPKAGFHAYGNGVRSDASASTAGAYTLGWYTVTTGFNDNTPNRELREQVITDGGLFAQALVYNGAVGGSLGAETYTQGLQGRMAMQRFYNDGTIDFWTQKGNPSTNSLNTVTLTKGLKLPPTGGIVTCSRTTTPTLDEINVTGAMLWCSNTVVYLSYSGDGSNVTTKQIAP